MTNDKAIVLSKSMGLPIEFTTKNLSIVEGIIKTSKKALKEKVYDQTFTGHNVKINVLWFDRNEGEYNENGIPKRFAGYKFMIASMLTKKETFDYLYLWLTTGEQVIDRNVKFWVAENDKARRKPPLSFNWNSL